MSDLVTVMHNLEVHKTDIFQCGLEEIFIGTLSQAMSALYVALYTKPVFSKQLTVGILQIQ